MNYLRTIQAKAHYFENYNIDGDTPYYKIKGEHVFEFEVDFNELMYREEELKKAINDKIARWSNAGEVQSCRYIVYDIILKDEVTDFGVLSLEHYEDEDLTENKINPLFCSEAAKDLINRNCNRIQNYRDEVVDYSQHNNNKQLTL